jgi:flavin-dependent dehydrogenase
MDVTGPGGTSVSADYPRGLRGAALTRRDLDALLLEQAIDSGATFDDGVLVQGPLMTSRAYVGGVRASLGGRRCDIQAPIVIAADGRRSRVALAMGLTAYASPRRWAQGAYFVDVAGVSTHGEMHVRGDGYIGIAPLPDGLVNVCVVRDRARVRLGPHAGRAAFVRAVVEADPVLRERFSRARQVSSAAALGPLAVDAVGAGCPGLLLAGDAAGFVDPMTGDGLRFALRGGELAAQAAIEELSSGSPAHAWLWTARAHEFGPKWRVNRGLRMLVDSPWAVGVATRLARRWQAPVRLLVRLAGDVDLVPDAAF